MERYTDTVSGEELYVVKRFNYKHYYKDRAMTIYHRIDGPAIEYDDGSKLWWVDGKRHRLDGPAMIWSNGTTDWYIDGVFIMELDKNGQIINRMK